MSMTNVISLMDYTVMFAVEPSVLTTFKWGGGFNSFGGLCSKKEDLLSFAIDTLWVLSRVSFAIHTLWVLSRVSLAIHTLWVLFRVSFAIHIFWVLFRTSPENESRGGFAIEFAYMSVRTDRQTIMLISLCTHNLCNISKYTFTTEYYEYLHYALHNQFIETNVCITRFQNYWRIIVS